MMAKAEAFKKSLPLAPGFEDKIRDVRYQVSENRFLVTFDSGKEYSMDRSRLECDDGTDLVTVKVAGRPFFFKVTQASGNKYEIPWDRVLYEAEKSYPYFKGRPRGMTKTSTVGKKIREMRNAKGLTQAELARAANGPPQSFTHRGRETSSFPRNPGANRSRVKVTCRGPDIKINGTLPIDYAKVFLMTSRYSISISRGRKEVSY